VIDVPKLSKATAERVVDVPQAEDRSSDLAGYSASFVTIKETHDLAPVLAAHPDGHCTCPHWGYVFEGRLVVRYGDEQEIIEAGEAFYLPPGHTPSSDAGSEFLMFSPTDELEATSDAIRAAFRGTVRS
jgi:mannose-6-phosphate isomerase-like protein (cupin superfamily)